MKKQNLQTKFKKELLIALFAMLTFFATSCIPTVPGGNPTPTSGTFNVNIDNNGVKAEPDNPKYKTVTLDGDTLLFAIYRKFVWVGLAEQNVEHISIAFQSSTGHTYEFYNIINNTPYPDTYLHKGLHHTLAAGVTVSNIPDSTHEWIPFVARRHYTNSNYDKEILFSQNPNGFIDPIPFWESPQGAYNQDRFIVFRRLKGTNYQYYWLRIKMLDKMTSFQYFTFGVPLPSTFIYNGKYQMNSITTGQ